MIIIKLFPHFIVVINYIYGSQWQWRWHYASNSAVSPNLILGGHSRGSQTLEYH